MYIDRSSIMIFGEDKLTKTKMQELNYAKESECPKCGGQLKKTHIDMGKDINVSYPVMKCTACSYEKKILTKEALLSFLTTYEPHKKKIYKAAGNFAVLLPIKVIHGLYIDEETEFSVEVNGEGNIVLRRIN